LAAPWNRLTAVNYRSLMLTNGGNLNVRRRAAGSRLLAEPVNLVGDGHVLAAALPALDHRSSWSTWSAVATSPPASCRISTAGQAG
jgi:hypothetical protein